MLSVCFFFSLREWLDIGACYPEKLWMPLPWMHSKADLTGPGKPDVVCDISLLMAGWLELDDL